MGWQMPRFAGPSSHVLQDAKRSDLPQSFISKLYTSVSNGLPFAEPLPALRVDESQLVRGVLHMLQGFSGSLFYWDEKSQCFYVKSGIYVPHLSQASLHSALDRFVFAATCLKLVELFVRKVEALHEGPPTLRAFSSSISMWLKRLRGVALKDEEKPVGATTETTATILGLGSSLSSICSGAEFLLQILHGSVPNAYFNPEFSIPSADLAAYILDHLYVKLNEVCLVQGGEEEAYHMLLALFTGTLLPYLDGLDSWLYDGELDDPYEELFFYVNSLISIGQPDFWEKSYLLRAGMHATQSHNAPSSSTDSEYSAHVKKETAEKKSSLVSNSSRSREKIDIDTIVCPLFLKEIAREILSAGKSLQLVQLVRTGLLPVFNGNNEGGFSSLGKYSVDMNNFTALKYEAGSVSEDTNSLNAVVKSGNDSHTGRTVCRQENYYKQDMRFLTLTEVFLISLVGLCGDGSHVSGHLTKSNLCSQEILKICKVYLEEKKCEDAIEGSFANWCSFIADTVIKKRKFMNSQEELQCFDFNKEFFIKRVNHMSDSNNQESLDDERHEMKEKDLLPAFSPENPAISTCRDFLIKNKNVWTDLNISRNFHLPPLNDESLRNAVFDENFIDPSNNSEHFNMRMLPVTNQTNYTLAINCSLSDHGNQFDDTKTLESLCPFPTFLPCFQDSFHVSEFIPFQRNSTLSSKVLNWVQSVRPKATPLPAIIIQESLIVYIKKQVDCVGKNILLKLMGDWKLMDELGVLRAIYLLGSGDLLQQFLIVIFDKLDKGDSWDDDFELNTILQESIRNSADGTILSSPDSLVVSIAKSDVPDDEDRRVGKISTPRKICNQNFGIDSLDMLKFTYKVSWPLDLIINAEAIRKYNQVMSFLLKVKRAKFVLDKARRLMWKCRGNMKNHRKHHMLVEQKLLHFVDAFHQYVMDRVFHSAWLELCSGVATAVSLDEVIEVHEAYLLSIQRQCFVAPDKLWALIASRVKIILGLALEFYTIQKTLISGGAAPAIKARCEMEVDRVEKQFDDCIAFLLRILSFKLNVGHFPHLADMVTRINYNYFYMTDNGNLLATPSLGTASAKPAKSLPGN